MSDTHNKNPHADRHEGSHAGIPANPVHDDAGDSKLQKRYDVFSFHGLVNIAKIIAGAITVLAAIIGLLGGLDWMIDRKLSSEAILRKIAAQSRPSLIFNSKESIVADMGAVQYVKPDDIRVTKRAAGNMPGHIHIGFVRLCSNAPILTPLHDVVEIKTERGKGLDWEFDLDWSQYREGKPDADILFIGSLFIM
jgi:hypothetical protein